MSTWQQKGTTGQQQQQAGQSIARRMDLDG